MKVARKHLITGLIGNALVFIIGLIGIVWLVIEVDNLPAILKYFTAISNFLVVLFSLINLILFAASIGSGKNEVKEIFQILKMISVAMCAITFTVVIAFLNPRDETGYDYYAKSQLFLHLITPIAAVFSYVFLEYSPKVRFRFFFVPAIPVVLYGIFYFVYAAVAPKGAEIDWYHFLFGTGTVFAPADFSKLTLGTFFIFLALSLGGAIVFGLALWVLNKIVNLIFIGYVLDEEEEQVPEQSFEEKVEDKTSEEESTEEEKVSKPAKAKSPAKKPAANNKYKDGARVYHIARSKFVSKKWQVKLAGGEKAIKIFDTQLEAIKYAKELTKKQGGSIRIHSMKGQLRK